ncbi:hypothetical protein B296_00043498 [Ensete ventricosum]|uniref:Uncharacterized protein n=1 Tax=Ensete ventricosum TaxID=4639 RepID=A0A426ZEB6_ENSVE|nr:hypothetical protein B296_00043498 [Ensete ventricosum]
MASLLPSPLSFAAFDASSAEASSRFFWKPLEPSKVRNFWPFVRSFISSCFHCVSGFDCLWGFSSDWQFVSEFGSNKQCAPENSGIRRTWLIIKILQSGSHPRVSSTVHGNCMCGLKGLPFKHLGISTWGIVYGEECGKSSSTFSGSHASDINVAFLSSVIMHIQFTLLKIDVYISRSFIKDWVSIGKSARLSTKAAAGNLSFEMQCRHCEKVITLQVS